MQVSKDNLLDIFKLIAGGLDRGLQLVLWLISHAREDIGDRGTPDLRIVFSTARLPQNESFMRVLHQDAVHRQFTTLVDERLVFGTLQTGVASANDEGLVTLEPSDLEQMKFGTFGAYIRDVARDGAAIELSLDSGHACGAERCIAGIGLCSQV